MCAYASSNFTIRYKINIPSLKPAMVALREAKEGNYSVYRGVQALLLYSCFHRNNLILDHCLIQQWTRVRYPCRNIEQVCRSNGLLQRHFPWNYASPFRFFLYPFQCSVHPAGTLSRCTGAKACYNIISRRTRTSFFSFVLFPFSYFPFSFFPVTVLVWHLPCRNNEQVYRSNGMAREGAVGGASRRQFKKLPGVGAKTAQRWWELGMR